MKTTKLAGKVVIFCLMAIITAALYNQAQAQTSPMDPSAFAGCGWGCVRTDDGNPACAPGQSSDPTQGCYVWDQAGHPLCMETGNDTHCTVGPS